MSFKIEGTQAKQSTILDNCTVCLEPLTCDEPKKLLDCSHLFHQACINSWLKHSPTCPNCRTPVVTCLTPMPRPAEMTTEELLAVPDYHAEHVDAHGPIIAEPLVIINTQIVLNRIMAVLNYIYR
jgi:hypothetical protein